MVIVRMEYRRPLEYRVESDGRYWLDIDGSKRFGLSFPTYKSMRNVVRRKYKLKRVKFDSVKVRKHRRRK